MITFFKNHKKALIKKIPIISLCFTFSFYSWVSAFCSCSPQGRSSPHEHSQSVSKEKAAPSEKKHAHDHHAQREANHHAFDHSHPSPDQESPVCNCDKISRPFSKFASSVLFLNLDGKKISAPHFSLPIPSHCLSPYGTYTHYGTDPPGLENSIPLYAKQSRLLI